MCGIVGYVGFKKAQVVLLEGLKKLEYRGYDSAGVAIQDGCLKTSKKQGNLDFLSEELACNPLEGKVGIGHTRWATHGKPSDSNSHPHVSKNKKFAVVHNGIIENYQELKEELEFLGYEFCSETDTEVIAHLLELHDEGDIMATTRRVIERLEGAYALGIVSEEQPDNIVAVRMASPLVLGLGQGENFIASDIPAILSYTKDIYVLESGEMAQLSADRIEVFDFEGNPINKELTKISWDVESAEKDGYDHFMLKEILEQPRSLVNTLRGRVSKAIDKVVLNELSMNKEQIKAVKKINIIACGTSYHAGLVGKEIIEKLSRIPVEVSIASEYRYRNPIVLANEITIPVSQSGETADTMAALMEAKTKGSRIVSITNCVDSSIARESDDIIYTFAGPEIAVASTKAYTSQLMAFNLLAIYLGQENGYLSEQDVRRYTKELVAVPRQVEVVLGLREEMEDLAKGLSEVDNLFFLGRGMDAHATLEGSLKLKEVSYIHSEAYAAGELKHGTLALITEGTPVVSVSTQPNLNEKTISNIIEVKARGAITVGVGFEDNYALKKVVDKFVPMPKVDSDFSPLISSIPMQLLAYYASTQRGFNPDQPRNLAKSVTVE